MGDVLYIPRGYVHSTTTGADCSSGDHSIHATLGLATDTQSLTYTHAALCMVSLARDEFEQSGSRNITWALESVFTAALANKEFRRALPLGFRSKHAPEGEADTVMVDEIARLLRTHVAGSWPELAGHWKSRTLRQTVASWFRTINRRFMSSINSVLEVTAQGGRSVQEREQLYVGLNQFKNTFTETAMRRCGLAVTSSKRYAAVEIAHVE